MSKGTALNPEAEDRHSILRRCITPVCRGCDDRDRAPAFEVDLPVDVLTDFWETHVDGFRLHCDDGVV